MQSLSRRHWHHDDLLDQLTHQPYSLTARLIAFGQGNADLLHLLPVALNGARMQRQHFVLDGMGCAGEDRSLLGLQRLELGEERLRRISIRDSVHHRFDFASHRGQFTGVLAASLGPLGSEAGTLGPIGFNRLGDDFRRQ
ncbi:hypothetical protein [Hyphomicrobium sp. CS1GBMeth3]|uniref:hypothetical protein n=1 Tax=Hyphomicrobium sp. CS1GBMeth3 TaxID=1892845 RepID=UPI001FCCDF5F|nr:hypothetical protein [Hyphomicrobium sp. CS1GBMeth3]